ncbi:UDP-galactose/UDP-glucose transporter 5 [Glycine soja]
MEWESLQGGKKGNRQGFHSTGRCLDAQKVHIINIYPPCDVQHRRELWESLKQLKNMNPDGIWCLMGDFNSIRNTSEREKSFRDAVSNCWSQTSTTGWGGFVLKEKIKQLKQKLKLWHKEQSGGTFKKVQELEEEINKLEIESAERQLSHEECMKRKMLQQDLWLAAQSHESIMRQKARLKWVKEGDCNFRYFHLMRNSNRRSNAVNGVHIEGVWVDEPAIVKAEIFRFFQQRYQEPELIRPKLNGVSFKSIGQQQNQMLVWGTAIMQKRYRETDYLLAFVVTLGCSVFILYPAGTDISPYGRGRENTVWGVLLMLGYLGCDGFTSTFQDKMFKGYNMEIHNQIFYTTLSSCILSLTGLIIQGHLLPAVEFVYIHKDCFFDIALLSTVATASQFFISYTIRTFGALTFATIMTTRQLVSILLSCVWFAHPLSWQQWIGAVIVFGAIYAKSFLRKAPEKTTSVEHVQNGNGNSNNLKENP